MTETTDKLPPLPEGAVYVGQLKDFSDEAIAGWVFCLRLPGMGWVWGDGWMGMSPGHNMSSDEWHLAVPESNAANYEQDQKLGTEHEQRN